MDGLIRQHSNRLDEESLRTFLCEVEYTINNRLQTVETLSDLLCTTIIARYSAYWKDKTCAALA